MKFEIKNRFTGNIIFALKTKSLELCIEAAIKQGIDLRNANLRNANLRNANLSYANLGYADLRYANLSYANLGYANLIYANLYNANLYNADLRNANLRNADLYNANLSYANLGYADLYNANLSYTDLYNANLGYADLRNANLSYTDLYNANLGYADLGYANLYNVNLYNADLQDVKGLNPYRCTPLLFLHDQVGKIRAYKLVNNKNEGIYQGGLVYEKGKTVEEKNANKDVSTHCGAGISLATLDWCITEWQEGYKILLVEFAAKDIAAIPTATNGKFRVTKCKVIEEVDLKKIGM